MLEELILFGRETADPWNRVTCCKRPVLLLIEFCQVVGPRPLCWFPKEPGPHLDLDQVALWVMSSENLHGSFSYLFNQQMGAHILVQYATILDISARAFQRPIAIAFLMADLPSPSFLGFYQEACVEFLRPLLSCNRQYFQWLIRHVVHVADNIETDNFNNYYALLSTNFSLPSKTVLSRGIKLIANQARQWHRRVMEGQNYLLTNRDNIRCDCGADLSEFEKFMPFIAEHSSANELRPILSLAPCTDDSIFANFEALYHWLLEKEVAKGLLFSSTTPVLRSFFGANSRLNEQDIVKEEVERVVTEKQQNQKSTVLPLCCSFRRFSFGFINSFLHILAGERIAVLASTRLEKPARELLRKMNLVRVGKRFEAAPWFNNEFQCSNDCQSQLVGFLCSSTKSLEWMNTNFPIVIDVNHEQLKCRKYVGKFLQPLANNNCRNFPSDESAIAYLVSLITDIQQYTLLAKYTSPKSVIHLLKLSDADQLILLNSLIELNVAKYSFLKTDVHQIASRLPLRVVRL